MPELRIQSREEMRKAKAEELKVLCGSYWRSLHCSRYVLSLSYIGLYGLVDRHADV